MSLTGLARQRSEQRQISNNDYGEWFKDWASGYSSSISGENVNSRTALACGAYFASIRNIAQDISVMPKDIILTTGKIRNPQPNHYHHRIANVQPNPDDGIKAVDFWQTIIGHALGYHGGFAKILRRNNGEFYGLQILDPNQVTVLRRDDGLLVYAVGPNKTPVHWRDMFHIQGFGFDGVTSYVLSTIQKELLGTAIATQNFTSAFFGNSAILSGVIEPPEGMLTEDIDHFMKTVREMHTDGADKKWKVFCLENGMKWQQISPDPQKAQLTELTYVNVENACRMLRMPPHKIQHNKNTTSNATVSELNYDYLVDTLMPWVVQIECEYTMKCFNQISEKDLSLKINTNSRLRGDPVKQMEVLKGRFETASITPNGICAYMDENPINHPLADMPFVNQTYIPISLIGQNNSQAAQSAAPESGDESESMDEHIEEDESADAAQESQTSEKMIQEIECIMRDALTTLLTRERDRIIDHSKRSGFVEWRSKFFAEHTTHVVAKLRPAIRIFGMSLGLSDDASLESIARDIADRHILQSESEIQAAKTGLDIMHWTSTRPTIEARQHMEFIKTHARP